MAALRATAWRRASQRALAAPRVTPTPALPRTRHIHGHPDYGTLPHTGLPLTPKLEFFNSLSSGPIPTFRVLDGEGRVLDGAEEPEVRWMRLRFSADETLALITLITQIDRDLARKL